MKKIFIYILKFYKYFISPLLGSNCRFYPSCSDYTREAIEIHGIVKGIYLGCKRIVRCQPLSKGGIDPVPQVKSIKKEQVNTIKQNCKCS